MLSGGGTMTTFIALVRSNLTSSASTAHAHYYDNWLQGLLWKQQQAANKKSYATAPDKQHAPVESMLAQARTIGWLL
jgi:hypothetical protein